MKKNLLNLLVWIIIIFIGFIIVHFFNENNKQQNDEIITVGYDDTFVPMGFVIMMSKLLDLI